LNHIANVIPSQSTTYSCPNVPDFLPFCLARFVSDGENSSKIDAVCFSFGISSMNKLNRFWKRRRRLLSRLAGIYLLQQFATLEILCNMVTTSAFSSTEHNLFSMMMTKTLKRTGTKSMRRCGAHILYFMRRTR
jgi:hypothetical protein